MNKNFERNAGWFAAVSDLKEGWVTLDMRDSYIRNMVTVNGGCSEAFANGYLASIERARAAARWKRR